MSKIREDADKIVQAALAAALPDAAVKRALEGRDFGPGRLVLVAAGKAAWQMAAAACGILGERLDAGIVVTKYGHVKGPIPGVECCEAGHPVPDENSFAATQKAIDLVSGLYAVELDVEMGNNYDIALSGHAQLLHISLCLFQKSAHHM